MKSTILFLVLAVLFGIYMVIKSKTISKGLGEHIKAGALVIDVRSKQEWDQGHFSKAVLIPIDQFEARLKEVGTDKQKPIIVYCRSGTRAAVAETLLKKNGFTKVINGRNYDALKRYDSR
jgi:phage shock protein E